MSEVHALKEGEVFEGPSKTLTDAHFLFFSALTGDVHPIHYDVEYAKTTPIGKPIAHVLLLVSLTALGALKNRERLGTLLFLEQYLPQAKVILWAANTNAQVDAMLQRRFPKVEIVKGSLSEKDGAVQQAVASGHGTKEIGGALGTRETGDYIVGIIQKHKT